MLEAELIKCDAECVDTDLPTSSRGRFRHHPMPDLILSPALVVVVVVVAHPIVVLVVGIL